MIDILLNSYSFYFVVIVFAVLVYQYFQVLKVSRQKDDYGKIRAVSILFGAFVMLLGISSVFADAIFEFLGLVKPKAYEIFSLIAFTILCLFSYLIMNVKSTQYKTRSNYSSGSVFDYEKISINNTQNNNMNNSNASEKILEYLGLATILKRFDIDINIEKDANTIYKNQEVSTSESLHEQKYDFEETTSKFTVIPTNDNIQVDEIPTIDIEHDKGNFDIDINLDDLLNKGG